MMQTIKLTEIGKGTKVAMLIIATLTLIAIVAYAYLFYQGQRADDTIVYKSRLQLEARAFTDKLILEIESFKALPEENTVKDVPESDKQDLPEKKTDEGSVEVDQVRSDLLQQLTDGYARVLTEQKQEALRQLAALIEMAKADWAEQIARQETTKEFKEKLLSEYLAKVSVLEAQMDVSFEELLVKITEQLKAEGFDPEPVIQEFRAEYARVKSENRSEMMSKALAAIKQKHEQ